MRKSIIFLILLLGILLGACGGDETPEATATPEPKPTTAVPPTPTEDNTFQVLQTYLGDWSGEWRNITFGSSGAVHATFSADEDGTLSITVDMDGFVFGALDPDPISYTGNFDAEGAVFSIPGDSLFGDLSMSVSKDGAIIIVGESVPDERIDSISAEGKVTPTEISLEYEVTFSTGDSAVGEMTLMKES